jgi:hypothetical protein
MPHRVPYFPRLTQRINDNSFGQHAALSQNHRSALLLSSHVASKILGKAGIEKAFNDNGRRRKHTRMSLLAECRFENELFTFLEMEITEDFWRNLYLLM